MITSGTASVAPELVLGYQTNRESNNVVHRLVDGSVSVTLRETNLRAGTLELFFLTEPAAAECVQMHADGSLFLFTEPERPTLSMTYVVAGRIGFALEEQTRDRWIVSVDYQEVDA
ncbi:hypothetical protein [Diaminobutyricimonas sp. LJ205]|uniref:hypothetical protein n=1 Tax=Diaminobutyricimonas sp. LJ205 TaxID=2683590 RepID=UPI0012F4DEAC|nr:hypothetical protein [Diaminobutyricimonas sp. LJ205]